MEFIYGGFHGFFNEIYELELSYIFVQYHTTTDSKMSCSELAM